jgi:hypothetical protein
VFTSFPFMNWVSWNMRTKAYKRSFLYMYIWWYSLEPYMDEDRLTYKGGWLSLVKFHCLFKNHKIVRYGCSPPQADGGEQTISLSRRKVKRATVCPLVWYNWFTTKEISGQGNSAILQGVNGLAKDRDVMGRERGSLEWAEILDPTTQDEV